MNQANSKLTELKKIREGFRTRIFLMMIEIAFVFLIPAFAAVFAGQKLDSLYGSSGSDKKFTLILLVLAFVISWVFVIFRFRRASRALKNVSAEIKKEEQRQNINQNG